MTLAKAEDCTGCGACRAACARGAIVMQADAEGFLRPVVDMARCVGCGACERACPVLRPGAPDGAPTCFAARVTDGALLRDSASGGVFSALAHPVLGAGGLVFGCRWEGPPLTAVHAAAEDDAGLAALRGSKYVQSDLRDTFREARAALQAGRRVLFSGTPCQIAGLLRFLGKPSPNLLTVEIICHSAPSPAVLARFREVLEAAHGGVPVTDLRFRDKRDGGTWGAGHLAWRLADGRGGSEPFARTFYAQAFFNHACSRPSCARCVAKEGRSGADVTIGDLWGVRRLCPAFDDDRGASVIAAHTPAGLSAVRAAALDLRPIDAEEAFLDNPYYRIPAPSSSRRAWFMRRFARISFARAAAYAARGPWLVWMAGRVCRKVRNVLANIFAFRITSGGAKAYSGLLNLPATA